MDDNTLRILEFSKVLDELGRYCSTGVGREKALRLRPGSDPETLSRLLAETSQMKRLLEDEERLPLAGIHDLRGILASLHERGRPIEEQEILAFRETLESAHALREYLLGLPDDLDTLREMGGGLREFDSLLGRFDLTVDARGRIRDDASGKLRGIRREMNEIEVKIEAKLQRVISSTRVRSLLQEKRYFFRDGRFVLPVRAESRGGVKGIIHDTSQSGNTVFVEPEEIVELGNALGDLRVQERREVSRILWELTRDILDLEGDLLDLVDRLAIVDLAWAKARFSLEFDLHPADHDPAGLQLRRARHPVLLMLGRRRMEEGDGGKRDAAVVPIDIRLGLDFDMLVITGPNTGGKTVTLKTVGLLALMNQCGLHIPAAPGSALPVFERVFADIGDEQSLEQSLSTFSAHMANISRILEQAGRDSLVLLDELGAGTDPAEGAALGVGILDYLLASGARAVLTTHIGSLKSYAYRHGRVANASVEFDVETLAPTYRLRIGQPGNSNAVTIARRIGMRRSVVDRAAEILAGERDGTEDLIHRLEETLKVAEGKRSESEDLREESLRIKESCERIRGELEERRRHVEMEADAEIDEILGNLLRRLAPLVRELRGAPRPFDDVARDLDRTLEEAVRSTPLARKREAFIRGLRKDDWVYIPRFRQRARVKRVSKDRRTVSVQVGAMALEVDFEDVSWLDT